MKEFLPSKRSFSQLLKRTREFITRPGGAIVKRPDRHVRGQDDGHPGRLDESNEINRRNREKNLGRWLNFEAVEGLRTLHLDLSTEPPADIIDVGAFPEHFYRADQPTATD